MTAKLVSMYERRLKVVYKHTNSLYYTSNNRVPWINISGRWLEKAGFLIGESVTVSVESDRLTITKCPENDGMLKKRV
ncbi:SymE family type I addiction module toxin [Filimonas effusa]|uniref:Type I toxin-antitoxin system SymE family toxin n=1 Tax=Filimonas effusa TaxID=2508721 RepID=A0A4Q1DCR3_9BACT|nr:SymE family type I addiction module toxin [Filimonas effusa]RXK86758.1 type I toxin-antitoxin system SymE family toxin [Filimonas effusa]